MRMEFPNHTMTMQLAFIHLQYTVHVISKLVAMAKTHSRT